MPEGFHEQPKQDAACLPARPDSTVEHPVVATEAPFVLQAPRPQGGEAMVLFDGARIVPVSSSWTCCQTRLENNGANGASSRIISSGRVRIDHLF